MRSDGSIWSFLPVSVHLVQMLTDILHVVNEPGNILQIVFMVLELLVYK